MSPTSMHFTTVRWRRDASPRPRPAMPNGGNATFISPTPMGTSSASRGLCGLRHSSPSPTRQNKSRPLTFPIKPVAVLQVLWQASRATSSSYLYRVLTGEDGHGSLCRAGEFHGPGNPQRQGVTEARGSLQSDGEDVRSDSERNPLDTRPI